MKSTHYRVCPDCGANLDPGEICDCKKERDTAATVPHSDDRVYYAKPIISDSLPDVNACFQLKEIRQKAGITGKEVALAIREKFPKFQRQLLAQLEAPEKYGAIIHPEALQILCEYSGVQVVSGNPPEVAVEADKPPQKDAHRKLGKKLTLRMTEMDFTNLQKRIEHDGYKSVQSWLYDIIIQALGVNVL